MRLTRLAIVITLTVASAPLFGRAQNDAGLVADPLILVIRTVTPTYPAIAKSALVRGRVGIDAVIETDGHVSDARITRSIPLLDSAAMTAFQRWEFAPLPVRTNIEAVFDFTFEEELPRPRVHSNLWRDPEPSKDDAVILNVSCNGGTLVFTSPPMSSKDEVPAALFVSPNISVFGKLSDVTEINDVARTNLAPFASRLFAWRETNPPMRVNVQGRRVLAVVPTSVPVRNETTDGADGILRGFYVRHAGVWTQLSPFGEDSTKPFYRDEFRRFEKRLRSIVRKNEAFRKLPGHMRACMADIQ